MYRLHLDTENEKVLVRDEFLDGSVWDSIPEVLELLINRFNGLNKLVIEIQGPSKWTIKFTTAFTHTFSFIMEEVSYSDRIDELEIELGMRIDSAFDYRWGDEVKAKIGIYPTNIGWGYTKESVWGEPVPLTVSAKKLLERYNLSINVF